MDISQQAVQQANGADFTNIKVDPQSGPDILVTAQLIRPTLSVSKAKTVVDAVINVGGAILDDIPPNKAGTQNVVKVALDEGKELAKIETDSDTLAFVIPVDITKGHKCQVSFNAQVKAVTQDTGANEQALANFTLMWDANPPAEGEVNNTSGTTQLKNQYLTVTGVGSTRDHVQLLINRIVTTDGAILTPTMSAVTITNLAFNLSES
jgi:hypothetical protein